MEPSSEAMSAEPSPMRVLVVDDERNIRNTLRICLEGFGCVVREATTPEATLETASPVMHAAIGLITRAAASDAAVLLRGESGTGKGVLARALHSMSQRRRRPFVTVNCPTLSEQLLTSELFGHVRGAFTGAVKDQPGRVEQAEGGTLFLDEVAEMSTGLQAQLLRFVQEKQFERLGEGKTRSAED